MQVLSCETFHRIDQAKEVAWNDYRERVSACSVRFG